MNLIEMVSQLFNLYRVHPVYIDMKRKVKLYFNELHDLRTDYADNDIFDQCIEDLAVLIYAYNYDLQQLKKVGFHGKLRNDIRLHSKKLEQSIRQSIIICNNRLNECIRNYERRSI